MSRATLFAPAPTPVTELGRYRILSKTGAVRVSPLCLGAMSIGSAWSGYLGTMSKDDGFKLMDEFVKLGGNFIDTSNNYQAEESETWIGEWMKARNNRDEMVIATKYTTYYKHANASTKVNYCGNSNKSLQLSVRDSLKKLNTDYIDILYIHWWDYSTSIEECMQSLNNLVKQGKVLYLGISDTPAWIVSKANQYARDHGLAQFVVYQGKWSVMDRDFERDILPMCLSEGMALAPWGAAGGGKFKSVKEVEERRKAGAILRGGGDQTEKEVKMSAALEKVREELGAGSVTTVALAYVLQKTPYVFPIVGGRTVEHLRDNIEAINLRLSPEHIKELEAVTSDFDVGFPSNFFGGDPQLTGEMNWLSKNAAHIAVVQQSVPLVGQKN